MAVWGLSYAATLHPAIPRRTDRNPRDGPNSGLFRPVAFSGDPGLNCPMPRLKEVSYDTPFEDVELADTSKMMRALLAKKAEPPVHIYLLHVMMPGWAICVRFRVLYPDGSDKCGYISIRDAEALKSRWKQRVSWLSKWTPGAPMSPMDDCLID